MPWWTKEQYRRSDLAKARVLLEPYRLHVDVLPEDAGVPYLYPEFREAIATVLEFIDQEIDY